MLIKYIYSLSRIIDKFSDFFDKNIFIFKMYLMGGSLYSSKLAIWEYTSKKVSVTWSIIDNRNNIGRRFYKRSFIILFWTVIVMQIFTFEECTIRTVKKFRFPVFGELISFKRSWTWLFLENVSLPVTQILQRRIGGNFTRSRWIHKCELMPNGFWKLAP